MSRRIITKKERLMKAAKRKKMLNSFWKGLIISLIFLIFYFIFYIPMLVNLHDIFLNPLGDFFYSDNALLLFIRDLKMIKFGIITLADLFAAFKLSCFYAFLFIGYANLMEYYRRFAGLLEIIIFTSCTVLLSLIYAFASSSMVVIAFTGLGCALTIFYLYAVQT